MVSSDAYRLVALALLLSALVALPGSSAASATPNKLGTYTVSLTSAQVALEPGENTLAIQLTDGDTPVANEPVELLITNGKRVFLDGTFTTDTSGTVVVTYFFNTPGEYTLRIKHAQDALDLPLHVRGQALLFIGFLTAIAIALGILLDKRAAASVF